MQILNGSSRRQGIGQPSSVRLLQLIVGLAAGLLLLGATPLAAQDACKPALDATMKIFDTSNHSYGTMNVMGKPQIVESIYAGGAVYMKYDGKWTNIGTTQEMKAVAEKNRRTNKATCSYLKDEVVGSDFTAVYTVHEVTPHGTSDSKLWISKSKGVPLRSDIDVSGGMHMSTRYEYGNIKPPM